MFTVGETEQNFPDLFEYKFYRELQWFGYAHTRRIMYLFGQVETGSDISVWIATLHLM